MYWIELFAGGGGVGTGLEHAGHIVSAAVEMEASIASCYRANHPNTTLLVSDVRDVTISDLPGEINALWASPVCKQDSKARNKKLARREDATIGLAILPYIKRIQPELVIIENVQLYMSNPAFTTIVAYLSRHYTLSMRVLDAANYGVPQHRERLILQARRGPIAWPEHTQRRTWYDVLSGRFDKMEAAKLAPWQRELWRPEYNKLLPVMVSGQYAFRDHKYDPKALEITPFNLPARTVTSSHNNTQKRIVLAQDHILRLSAQDNARLQSFPENYIWPEGIILAQEIIGNAVPPLMVQALTKSYVDQMEYVA
jgi:DNA (cytosine-5)-methyltransferase 1